MKLTVSEIKVHKENENPIFGESVTSIKLDDEGGGMFVKIIQDNGTQMNEIRFDFNEIEYILKAIEILKENAGDPTE
jgi:hypothetical protein